MPRVFTFGWLCVVIVAAGVQSSHAQPLRAPSFTQWNNSPDPSAPYGGCQNIGPATYSKLAELDSAGVSTADVLAITVLSCVQYNGQAGARIAACPAGSPYQVCVSNGNDGHGNAVAFGVLTRGTATDSYQPYQGCPTNAKIASKLSLVEEAGADPRLINGVVTISCAAATATGSQPVQQVACPVGRNPFAYCLRTANDGLGNAVEVGVIGANGPGDPFGLYGECGSAAQGISAGLRPKINLVYQANLDASQVTRIDLLSCKINQGEPKVPTKTTCGSLLGGTNLAARYKYCVWGTDPLHNSFIIGVVTLQP